MPTKKGHIQREISLLAENERLTKVLQQIQTEFRMFNNSDMPDGRGGCDGNIHVTTGRSKFSAALYPELAQWLDEWWANLAAEGTWSVHPDSKLHPLNWKNSP